jgi:hypothetical protein
MGHEDYKRTLETAKSEVSELLRQRKAIDAQIGKLAPLIENLSVLCDEIPALPPELSMPSEFDMGLSDAIRLAFKSARPNSLTPTEVRDKLRASGFNLDKYANELPPIHNTIMRLLKQGEIEEDVPRREGRAYKWVSSLKRALLEIEPSSYGATNSLANMMRAQLETEQAVMPPTREQVLGRGLPPPPARSSEEPKPSDVTAYVAGRKYKKE